MWENISTRMVRRSENMVSEEKPWSAEVRGVTREVETDGVDRRCHLKNGDVLYVRGTIMADSLTFDNTQRQLVLLRGYQ